MTPCTSHCTDDSTALMPRIRAITLDLDDTLWPIQPTIERAEAALHAWLARHAPAVVKRYDIEALRVLRDGVLRDRPDLEHDFTRIRHYSISLALQRCGHDPALADAAFEAFFTVRNELELYPEVDDALQALSSRYALLAVTNGNADISRMPVARHFQGSVSARELGVGKPDPRIFEAACERLRMAPHEVMHVGDDWQLDVEGALGAGLWAVWLHRTGTSQQPSCKTEAGRLWIVQDLAMLVRRLGEP
jgi:putative hydrolase of the HAD superfamily